MANLDSISPMENESVSNVTLTNSVQLGTRRTVNAVDYIYVYNNGGFQISQGQMGNIGTASMNSGFSVTVTNAASHVGCWQVVGVAYNATIATAQYGWLATRGLIQGVPDTGAISANSGDLLTVGVDGGFVSFATTAGTGITFAFVLGVALNSFITTPTAGNNHIYFNSPMFG